MPLPDATITSAEPDAPWPPSTLDFEPEQAFCLLHGEELPCAVCQAVPTSTTPKESA